MPEIERVFFTKDEETALQVEEHLVTSYGIRRKGGLLCNYLDKCFSANTLDIPEEVYELMGTMKDKDLGELTGINWSTLMTKRMNRGIPSFKSKTKGNPDHIVMLRRKADRDKVVTLYNTNGETVTKNFYDMVEFLSVKPSRLKDILRGDRKHVNGWYIEEPIGVIDRYTVRKCVSPSGEVFKGTYLELSKHIGCSPSISRGLFSGKLKSIFKWRLLSE
jgi:hypothetical protein